MTELAVAFVCDYAAERWPSMDLLADELPRSVQQVDPAVQVERLQPVARRWFGGLPRAGWQATTAERLINRYLFYPPWLRRRVDARRVFHVLDHSYAHLVAQLPTRQTLVTCHDVDAFTCVLNPAAAPRPWLFREAVRRTLRGLQRAGRIACVSETVRQELLQSGLASPSQAVVVPNGIHPAFSSDLLPADEACAGGLLGSACGDGAIDLLHVGLPIARKRIDVAIQILARLRRAHLEARLIRVGGPLTPALRQAAATLGVLEHVLEVPFVPAGVLAAIYKRAHVVIVPSDREGFALPIVEAFASGTRVVANDIAVLRETGGCLARYCDNCNVGAWCDEILLLVAQSGDRVRSWQASARAHAAEFSWRAAAERLLPIYRELSA